MRIAAVLVATALVVPQQDGGRSVEEEITALIEKTNDLETFHLVYHVEREGEDPMKATFEFVYRAPDLARMKAAGDEGEMDMWVTEQQVIWRDDMEGDGEWNRVPFPESLPAKLVLDELFPREETSLGPGVLLDMIIRDNAETKKAHFEVSFKRTTHGRPYVLGWLDTLRKRSADVSIEDESFVLTEDHYRLRVSRMNGMLEHLEADSDRGPVEFELRECDLDEALDEGLIAIPDEATNAPIDPEMTQGFESLFGLGALRHEAFLRIEGQLGSGKHAWNELTRSHWRAFLTALHHDMIFAEHSDWLEELQDYVDDLVEWVRTQRAGNDSPELRAELQRDMAERRVKMAENFETSQEQYEDDLPAVESKHAEPRQELFNIELEVIDELWDELLSEPVLTAFDEKLAEALE